MNPPKQTTHSPAYLLRAVASHGGVNPDDPTESRLSRSEYTVLEKLSRQRSGYSALSIRELAELPPRQDKDACYRAAWNLIKRRWLGYYTLRAGETLPFGEHRKTKRPIELLELLIPGMWAERCALSDEHRFTICPALRTTVTGKADNPVRNTGQPLQEKLTGNQSGKADTCDHADNTENPCGSRGCAIHAENKNAIIPTPENRHNEDNNEDNNENPTSRPDSDFERAWLAYPRKDGSKTLALAAWDSATRERRWPGTEKILSAIASQKNSNQWTADNGKYVPYFSNWIKGCRWNDTVVAAPRPPMYRRNAPRPDQPVDRLSHEEVKAVISEGLNFKSRTGKKIPHIKKRLLTPPSKSKSSIKFATPARVVRKSIS